MKVKNRIKRSNDFALVINEGQAKSNSCFTIHYKENNLNYVRVGVSVSKKLGGAVIRNRIKRQIRAMCDELLDYDKESSDLVVITRKDFLANKFNKNKSLLNDLLKNR